MSTETPSGPRRFWLYDNGEVPFLAYPSLEDFEDDLPRKLDKKIEVVETSYEDELRKALKLEQERADKISVKVWCFLAEIEDLKESLISRRSNRRTRRQGVPVTREKARKFEAEIYFQKHRPTGAPMLMPDFEKMAFMAGFDWADANPVAPRLTDEERGLWNEIKKRWYEGEDTSVADVSSLISLVERLGGVS